MNVKKLVKIPILVNNKSRAVSDSRGINETRNPNDRGEDDSLEGIKDIGSSNVNGDTSSEGDSNTSGSGENSRGITSSIGTNRRSGGASSSVEINYSKCSTRYGPIVSGGSNGCKWMNCKVGTIGEDGAALIVVAIK